MAVLLNQLPTFWRVAAMIGEWPRVMMLTRSIPSPRGRGFFKVSRSKIVRPWCNSPAPPPWLTFRAYSAWPGVVGHALIAMIDFGKPNVCSTITSPSGNMRFISEVTKRFQSGSVCFGQTPERSTKRRTDICARRGNRTIGTGSHEWLSTGKYLCGVCTK